MGYRSIISLMPKTPPVDADAQAFLTAAAITDPTISGAINTLVVQMKADNIWSKMKAIYPMVGGSASAHKFNLKDPRDLDAAFRLVFNGGWTHSNNGATPNGTNADGDTKLIASTTLSQNSTHFSYYSRTNIQGNADLGNALGAAFGASVIWIRWSDNNSYLRLNAGTSSIISTTNSLGMFIVNRNSSTQINYIRNGVQSNFNNTSQGLVSTNTYRIAGNTVDYGNKQCAFASIGDGLSDTDAANLYTRVQAFNTALSRQV